MYNFIKIIKMLSNIYDKNNNSILIVCESCGCTAYLLNKFLPSLRDITCGQCDTKGNFKIALENKTECLECE